MQNGEAQEKGAKITFLDRPGEQSGPQGPVDAPQPAISADAPQESANGLFSILEGRTVAAPEPVLTGTNTQDVQHTPQVPIEPASGSNPDAGATTAQETPRGESRKTAEATAQMFTTVMNISVKKICGALSGTSGENFGLTEEEKEEYKQVCIPYFMEQGSVLTPKQMFLLATGSLFGGSIINAWGVRKDRTEQAKAAAKIKQQNTARVRNIKRMNSGSEAVEESAPQAPQATVETRNDTPTLFDHAEEEPAPGQAATPRVRNRFEIDAKGFYERDIYGKYIKRKQRLEKPTGELAAIIKGYARKVDRTDADGNRMTWGEANKHIRQHLYGQSEPVISG